MGFAPSVKALWSGRGESAHVRGNAGTGLSPLPPGVCGGTEQCQLT